MIGVGGEEATLGHVGIRDEHHVGAEWVGVRRGCVVYASRAYQWCASICLVTDLLYPLSCATSATMRGHSLRDDGPKIYNTYSVWKLFDVMVRVFPAPPQTPRSLPRLISLREPTFVCYPFPYLAYRPLPSSLPSREYEYHVR